MSAFVGLLSLVGILVGLVSVIVPLRFFKIQSRRAALMVVAASSATLFATVALDTRADAPVDGAKAVRAPRQQAIAAPAVDNGCHLAGALPNCEEEVAKLMAANAATAPALSNIVPLPSSLSVRSNPGRDFVTEKMDEIRAKQASANVRALAFQREYDAAVFRAENANTRLERSVSDYNAVAQRQRLESESIAYDRRIRERERERRRRGF